MGQKTNPNIFQLEKTNNWQSKYFEKKILEHSIYSKKDKEIRQFIFTFFKNHKITIHNCRIYYLNKSLHIFISYYQNLNSNFSDKNVIYLSNQINKFKKLELKNLKTKLLLDQFFKSLIIFMKKKIKIFLALHPLNNNIKQIFNPQIKKFLKKKLINLRKYKQNDFFHEGINILFRCATNKKSAKLLTEFISIQLKTLKHHNFFFKFLKNTLVLFKNNIISKFKGIKIKIKGRLNGRPRARSKIIKIANNISVLTIDSKIDYSEITAFNPNGTLGVKVWIQET